ncbi:MAG: hypothetical protein BAA00_03490 [Parageobacillus thermoglucosidasius]|nr:MAG: hypothetical protein BAA00_03490 [Parageobacillus thermoglucosidasius]
MFYSKNFFLLSDYGSDKIEGIKCVKFIKSKKLNLLTDKIRHPKFESLLMLQLQMDGNSIV